MGARNKTLRASFARRRLTIGAWGLRGIEDHKKETLHGCTAIGGTSAIAPMDQIGHRFKTGARIRWNGLHLYNNIKGNGVETNERKNKKDLRRMKGG